MSKGILIVDMINDFVYGKFGSPRAQRIIPSVGRLCSMGRQAGVSVFYVRDAHHADDPELRVWGEHAMAGTWGSEIVPELKPEKGDRVFDKRQYSGFLNTSLHRALKAKGVLTLFVAGVSTDICVQHNVADAFFRGYRTVVPRECVESIEPRRKAKALKYMEDMYGSRIEELDKVKF